MLSSNVLNEEELLVELFCAAYLVLLTVIHVKKNAPNTISPYSIKVFLEIIMYAHLYRVSSPFIEKF